MTGEAERNQADARFGPGGGDVSVDPASWPDGCLGLLHELWGAAIDSTPYNRQQKLKFARLLAGLEHQASRDGLLRAAAPVPHQHHSSRK